MKPEAAAELRVICSNGHDDDRPLRICTILLNPVTPEGIFHGLTVQATAQQRGGQDARRLAPGDSKRMTFTCPRCAVNVEVRNGRVYKAMRLLAEGPRVVTAELRDLATFV